MWLATTFFEGNARFVVNVALKEKKSKKRSALIPLLHLTSGARGMHKMSHLCIAWLT
jgi:hypothetical protein